MMFIPRPSSTSPRVLVEAAVLGKPGEDGILVCPESGFRYRLEDGILRCLDLAEELPLSEGGRAKGKPYVISQSPSQNPSKSRP